eukprot:5048-Heterococcus_DN1.PRE.3
MPANLLCITATERRHPELVQRGRAEARQSSYACCCRLSTVCARLCNIVAASTAAHPCSPAAELRWMHADIAAAYSSKSSSSGAGRANAGCPKRGTAAAEAACSMQ